MPKIKFRDERGEHCRIYVDILDSPAYMALSWAQRALYIALCRKRKSFNNGNIEATLSDLRRVGFTSSASLAMGLRALRAVGLIDLTRNGHLSQGRRVCNLFRFTDHPVYENQKLGIPQMPPTNEWKKFRTVASAKHAIEEAHAAARTGRKRGYPVRISRPLWSEAVQSNIRTGSDSLLGGGTSSTFDREQPALRSKPANDAVGYGRQG